MNPFFKFDLRQIRKRLANVLIILVLLAFGVFTGSQFNLTVGEGVYLNSPYTIGFMTGLLSLSIIFIATVIANQLLFKEFDSNSDVIIFALPVSKLTYLKGRFLAFFTITFCCFALMMMGFMVGQQLRTGTEIRAGFHLMHYLLPLLTFGLFNSLFVCSALFLLAFSTRKKLLVIVGGLLLYVLYMVSLLFSNSPFMAGALPQSITAQKISAILDPFGLSAYFFESRNFSPAQRNAISVPFGGYVMLNHFIFTMLSALFLILGYVSFSFTPASSKSKSSKQKNTSSAISTTQLISASTYFDLPQSLKAILSFAKKDCTYLFKSISIIAISILLLFYCGMEMYAEIEKGIRIPQKYASAGLMATTIIQNFHLIGMLILVYFVNDVFWRSHASGFSLMENSTYFSKAKTKGHFLAISILLLFFSTLLIIEGLVFQWMYTYFHIDWGAYLSVFLFCTFPLMLFAGLLIGLNQISRNKFLALGLSMLALLLAFPPISKKLFSNPLLRIFSDFKGEFSDFDGFGPYVGSFALRLTFGACLILLIILLMTFLKNRKFQWPSLCYGILLLAVGFFSGKAFLEGYQPKEEWVVQQSAARYEKQYRKFKKLPQPTVTSVKTNIDLFPAQHAYHIKGSYQLKNLSNDAIKSILLHFHPDLKIETAQLKIGGSTLDINQNVSAIELPQALQPEESAVLTFKIAYQWFPSNGHQSFNSIIENGTFLRVSRYFPSIGYQADYELQDEKERAAFGLAKVNPIKKVIAPAVYQKDFIDLDMTISTEAAQTAIGTGDLEKQWKGGGRNYFQYQANGIPFRFGLSSAVYQKQSASYQGIAIHVFYHPSHYENVAHLLKNAQLTLDYCIRNFGKYPFKSINFAEISSFTRGFAATAYPSAIFMPEDMIFHSNIHADQQQDVINELAGHELSHLWWGNSGINPDDREGAVMLTETLAMYTEMMLYQKMHGKAKMQDRVKMHQQIYDAAKGFAENQPLYKVTADNTHISYSKGAVAMVKLTDLIGEEKVNFALRNFLNHNTYPKKPSALDLLEEFYKVSPERRNEIYKLFK